MEGGKGCEMKLCERVVTWENVHILGGFHWGCITVVVFTLWYKSSRIKELLETECSIAASIHIP